MEKTPNDGAFRRSLFIVLVVIGIIATAGWLEDRDDLAEEKRERQKIERQYDTLLNVQAEILAQGKANEQRAQGFEELLAAFLAGSSDPVVAEALQQMGVTPAPETDRTPAGGGRPITSAAPRPGPTPAPPGQPKPPAPAPSTTPEPPVVIRPPLPLCTTVVCIKP